MLGSILKLKTFAGFLIVVGAIVGIQSQIPFPQGQNFLNSNQANMPSIYGGMVNSNSGVLGLPISQEPKSTPSNSVSTAPESDKSAPSSGLSNDKTYVNSNGNTIHSPAYSTNGQIPPGSSALCSDGTYSFSQHREGTCSSHGGVSSWLDTNSSSSNLPLIIWKVPKCAPINIYQKSNPLILGTTDFANLSDNPTWNDPSSKFQWGGDGTFTYPNGIATIWKPTKTGSNTVSFTVTSSSGNCSVSSIINVSAPPQSLQPLIMSFANERPQPFNSDWFQVTDGYKYLTISVSSSNFISQYALHYTNDPSSATDFVGFVEQSRVDCSGSNCPTVQVQTLGRYYRISTGTASGNITAVGILTQNQSYP